MSRQSLQRSSRQSCHEHEHDQFDRDVMLEYDISESDEDDYFDTPIRENPQKKCDRNQIKKTRTIFSTVSKQASKSQLNTGIGKSGDGEEVRFPSRKPSYVLMNKFPVEEEEVTEPEDDDYVLPGLPSKQIPSQSQSASCKGRSQPSTRSSLRFGHKFETSLEEAVEQAVNRIVENKKKAELQRSPSKREQFESSANIVISQEEQKGKDSKLAAPRKLILRQNSSEQEDIFSKVITIHNPTSTLYAFKILYATFANRHCSVTPDIGLIEPRSKVYVEIKATESLYQNLKDAADAKLQLKIFPPHGCIENDEEKLEKCFKKMCIDDKNLIRSEIFKPLMFLSSGKKDKSRFFVPTPEQDDEKENNSGVDDVLIFNPSQVPAGDSLRRIVKGVKSEIIKADACVKEIIEEMSYNKQCQNGITLVCVMILLGTIYGYNLMYSKKVEPEPEPEPWWYKWA